jgi:hypothetical protein
MSENSAISVFSRRFGKLTYPKDARRATALAPRRSKAVGRRPWFGEIFD